MASQLQNGRQQFIDINGRPLIKASVYFYAPGTSNKVDTFQDQELTIPNTNPVITDGRGQATIWGGGSYRQVVIDSNGVTIWDQIVSDVTAGITAQITAAFNLIVSNLAAFSGAAMVGWIQSGAGAIFRWVQEKLRESISIEDYLPTGFVRDGSVDYTNQLNAALAYAGTIAPAVVKITNNMRVFVNSGNIIVPAGVTLKGPWTSPGWTKDGAAGGYGNIRGSIILNPSYTINILGRSASVVGLYIIKSGLTIPVDAATAQTLVNSFAGTAITVGDETNGRSADFYCGHCCILGFNQAIYNDYSERYTYEFITADCTNGIYNTRIYDIGRVRFCHLWPFVTYGFSFSTTNLVWKRTGTAYSFGVGNDASEALQCFSFGYQIGFHVAAENGVTLVDCTIDAYSPAVDITTIGLLCDGAAGNVMWKGGTITGVGYGVYQNSNNGTGGMVTVVDTQFWGNTVSHVYQNSARLRLRNCALRDLWGNPSSGPFINATSTALSIEFSDCEFENTTNAWSIGAPQFNQYNNRFQPTNAGTIASPQRANRTYDNIANSSRALSTVATSNNFGIIDTNRVSRGSIAAPVVSNNGDSAYMLEASIYNGLFWGNIAAFRAALRSTPTTTSNPGSWIFSTCAPSTTGTTDVLLINENGSLIPVTDNAVSLGGSGNRFSSVWAANGTIQTSDARTKTDISDSILGLDFINGLRPVSYKWIEGSRKVIRQTYFDSEGNEVPEGVIAPEGSVPGEVISESMPGIRTHWGLIAQEVKALADKSGIDFGGWVLSDENDPDSQQAIRYDQFIAPLIKAVQQLSTRVVALEAKE